MVPIEHVSYAKLSILPLLSVTLFGQIACISSDKKISASEECCSQSNFDALDVIFNINPDPNGTTFESRITIENRSDECLHITPQNRPWVGGYWDTTAHRMQAKFYCEDYEFLMFPVCMKSLDNNFDLDPGQKTEGIIFFMVLPCDLEKCAKKKSYIAIATHIDYEKLSGDTDKRRLSQTSVKILDTAGMHIQPLSNIFLQCGCF